MRSNLSPLKVLIIAMAFTLGLTDCVKKRKDVVAQGQNLDELYTMGDRAEWKLSADSGYIIETTKYTIRTSTMMKKSENTAAEKSKIEPGASFIKHLDIMNFESDDPLLAGSSEVAEMFGEPNKTYPVQHEITPDFLIINKIVSEEDVATFEKTYSRRQGSNWVVPIGGYPIIGFFTLEKVLNEENRSTNVTTKISVPSQNFKTATHYDINEAKFMKFGRIQKTDVLPKSFFTDGEWYFSETVVKVRYDRAADVGDVGSSDSDLNPASRIKFEIKDNSLIGLNTNVDEDFKNEENKENFNTVVKIPVELFDYKRFKTGDSVLSEQVDNEKKVQDRDFIKLDFSNSETPTSAASEAGASGVLNQILNKVTQFKTLLDVTFADNFMSFSIHDARSGQIKRYAMRKITIAPGSPGAMVARRWFKEDHMIFGVFPTVRAKKMDYKVHQQEDIEKLFIMARHNPNKNIVYHFSDQTPKDDWYRNIGREAVNIWQQAFRKAGLKNTVILDESFDVALGDIRYNVINIVRDGIGGNLGFGPSLTDSETGEMVSSSMNLGMEPILGRHYDAIRSFLGRESGNVYDLQMTDDVDTTLPLVFQLANAINTKQAQLRADGTWTINDFAGLDASGTRLDPSKFSEVEKSLLSIYDIDSSATIQDVMLKFGEIQNHHSTLGMNSRYIGFRFYALGGDFSSAEFTDSFIKKQCPAVVQLAERMKTSLVLTDEELSIIQPCVSMLAQSEGLWAAIHEMGHNFALAHNFRGSTDKTNYPKVGSYSHKFLSFPDDLMKLKTSSAMDYLTTEGRQLTPGDYDLAALRWIYRGEVEDKSGGFVAIDLTKPIRATLSDANRKKFSFCSDSNRINATDPMCDAFDQGLNSKEIVQFTIDSTYKQLSSIYRYNTTGAKRLEGLLSSNLSMLKQQYDTWRSFLKNETGLNRKYLQNMSAEEYQKTIDGISNQAAVKEHLEVRNMIIRFILNIAFMNNKYCVVTQDEETTEQYVELERIRKELMSLGDISVVNTCQSPAVVSHLAEKNMVVKREIGHFLESGIYSLDPNTSNVPDFSGTIGLRIAAFAELGARYSPSLINRREGYAPNYLDEPDVRAFVNDILLDRVSAGLRVNALRTQPLNQPKDNLFGTADSDAWKQGVAIKKFDSEKDLIKTFISYFNNGLGIPGDGQATFQRSMPYFVSTIQNPEMVKGQYTNTYDFGGGFLWVRSNEGFAGKIMTRIGELDKQKALAQTDPQKIKPLKNTVLLAISSLLPKGEAPFTVGDLLKLYEGVTKIAQTKDPVKDAAFMSALNLMLFAEISVVNQVDASVQSKFQVDLATLQQLVSDPGADPKQKEQATKILNQISAMPVAEFYKAMNPNLKPPNVANLAARFDEAISGLMPTFADYSRNREEYDAQSKLLLDSLLVIAR